LPVVHHAEVGPLRFCLATLLATACTNVRSQRGCQRYREYDWRKMLENPIIPKSGVVRVAELRGFGMQIRPEAWKQAKHDRGRFGHGISGRCWRLAKRRRRRFRMKPPPQGTAGA
jgi:L-alanine-DL-glutamate epimerase-like enolase superfamily enzyme